MGSDVSALRSEHDQVLAGLEARVSTTRFAHGAVSLFVSALGFGTAGKLAWDFWTTNPEWAVGVAVHSGAILLYGVVRLVQGFRLYALEKAQVARLLELRAQLGVDAPAGPGA
jgi:hypothetical protein